MYVFLAIKMLLIPIGAALICKQLPVDAGVYKAVSYTHLDVYKRQQQSEALVYSKKEYVTA